MKSKNKSILAIISLFIILFMSMFLYADVNGVWHRAEDIRGGIFGLDQDEAPTDYQFINPVDFDDEITVTTIKSSNGNGNVVIQLG
ncbi:MAG: hypothetical protein PF569_02800 [Candidatus Woesearchaeota archaeon]|nr:hypothetical protein [Candidatus Woesearchaeota archaeon]